MQMCFPGIIQTFLKSTYSIDTSDLEGKEHPTLVLCNSQPLTKRAPLAFAAAAASGQGGNGTAILEEYVSKVCNKRDAFTDLEYR